MRWMIVGLFAISVFAAEPRWPQFRGPAATGIGTGTGPLTWNGEANKNVMWKTPLPGLGHSSPVIWGDRIFITSAVPAAGDPALKLGLYGDIGSVKDEGEHAFILYCIDRKSGKILWQKTAAKSQPEVKRHPKSTHANPTPATDGRYVVAFFGSEGLYTYDMNGKLIWQKDFGVLDSAYFQAPTAQWGFASSPVIHNGMLIIQADVMKDSFLAAFDLKTGKELWRTERKDVPTWGTPAIAPYTAGGAKSEQIVVNGWKHIGGYDLKTGKELWKLEGGGDIPVPTPVYQDGLIVITNAHGPGRPIYAIRTDASGTLTKTSPAIAWSHDRAGNYMQTPLLHGGLAYFCFDNGVLSVYDLKTGERQYQQRLGTGTNGFSSSPVLAGDRLYVTNEDGHTFVIGAGRQYKLLGENELGETVMASPAVAEGVLYIRGRKHLYAIAEK
jgi:outer membrane protein assembly factor BamB